MTLIFIGMADPYIKSIFFISTSRDFHFMEKSLDLVFAHYAYIYNNIQFKYCFTLFFFNRETPRSIISSSKIHQPLSIYALFLCLLPLMEYETIQVTSTIRLGFWLS